MQQHPSRIPTHSVESFQELESVTSLRHAFVARIHGVDVDCDREEALRRLHSHHQEAIRGAGLGGLALALAEQVHGSTVAIATPGSTAPGADALITNQPGVCLGIYVADCAAVFLADRRGRAIGLVHSGKKGTELGISAVAVQRLVEEFGCNPADLLAVISPCIRPPHYETDFAKQILEQLVGCGVGRVIDSGVCTASEPSKYYSYRREMGRTGRMLALLAMVP